jgi:hypothetical protein
MMKPNENVCTGKSMMMMIEIVVGRPTAYEKFHPEICGHQ